jgi:hypothetical protein
LTHGHGRFRGIGIEHLIEDTTKFYVARAIDQR